MCDNEKFVYEIINSIYKGIEPLIVETKKYAYISDPVLDVKRNRVVAETLKAIIRLDLDSKDLMQKLANYLMKTQNKDGSWNEIHPNYDKPSALITSIVAESLILFYKKSPNKKLKKSIVKAAKYVISQNKKSGYFLKSKTYTADHLNVDATCGAFLALYGKLFSDKKSINIAKNAAKHICKNQFENGAYPYAVTKGNYSQTLDVSCVHYQGVTIYYLSKINQVISEKWLKDSLIRGVEWLSKAQKSNGKFDWSKSGLMFAYCLSGAYAFAYSSFSYISKFKKEYAKNSELCLLNIKSNAGSLVFRWEKESWLTFPLSTIDSLKTAKIGDYSRRYILFRFGYALYRQIARRRISERIDGRPFKIFTKILKLKTSTVESFTNHPDLFMSSEILDCLSYSLVEERA